MCLALEGDGDVGTLDVDFRFASDETSVELWGIAELKAAELFGEHGVEGVGDHGKGDVEVDFDEDGGGEGVEVEELDGLSDAVFDAPTSSVVAEEKFSGAVEVIGNEEGGFLMAVAADDELAYLAGVATEGDG